VFALAPIAGILAGKPDLRVMLLIWVFGCTWSVPKAVLGADLALCRPTGAPFSAKA
jgi:hypothetical protein